MKKTIGLALVLVLLAFGVEAKQINVLMIGDSTTHGATPKAIHPERPQLIGMTAAWYNAQSTTDSLVVYKSARGGETARSVIDTGRYEKEILPFKESDIDIIIVRYGINDWYKCDDIDMEFPADLATLWKQLKRDFPHATYIAQSITPFLKTEESVRMNNHIKRVAEEQQILFNDIYTPFAKAMEQDGEYDYWVRLAPLDNFPAKYHKMLEPYTYKRNTREGTAYWVQVDDNSLDYLFMTPPPNTDATAKKKWLWVNHHPNTAGYSIIAKETANYLLSL